MSFRMECRWNVLHNLCFAVHLGTQSEFLSRLQLETIAQGCRLFSLAPLLHLEHLLLQLVSSYFIVHDSRSTVR